MTNRSKENAIDWDLLEKEYRLGHKSNKQLSIEYGVSLPQIGRKAKQKGWVQDKRKDVAAATNSMLIQLAAGNSNPLATPTQADVNEAAKVDVQVIMGHRKSLQRISGLRDKMLEEIEVATETDGAQLIRELAEIVHPEDYPADMPAEEREQKGRERAAKMRKMLNKLLSLPDRIDNLKKLAEIDAQVRKGEREAYGIGEGSDGGSDLEQLLARVKGMKNSAVTE